MDAQTLLRLFIARKGLILLFGSISGIGAYLLGLFLVTYEAKGQLIVRPVGTSTFNTAEWSALGMVSSPYIDNVRHEGLSYISILRSREVVGRVVDQLDLQKKFEVNTSRYIESIKRPLQFLFYGRPPATKRVPREEAIDRTKKSILAILISSSSVIRISVKSDEAKRAHDIANTLMDTFVTYSAEQTARSAEEAADFLGLELKDINIQKVDVIARLEALRKTHGIRSTGTVAQQITGLGERINRLDIGVDEYLSQLALMEQKVADLEKRIATIPEDQRWSYTVDKNPELVTLRQTLFTQKLDLITAQVDFRPGSAEIAARKKQIKATNEAIKAQLERVMLQETFRADQNRGHLTLDLIRAQTDIATLPVAIEGLQRRIEGYNRQISQLNAISEELGTLENEVVALGVTETEFRRAISDARVIARRGLSEFKVIERAVIPRYPSIHGLPLAMFVVIATYFGGFVAIFYIFYRDGRISRSET